MRAHLTSMLLLMVSVATAAHARPSAAQVDALLDAAVEGRRGDTWVHWPVDAIERDGEGGFGCSWSHESIYSEALRFDGEKRDRSKRVLRRPDRDPRRDDRYWIFAGFRRGELDTVLVYDADCLPPEIDTIDRIDAGTDDTARWLAARVTDRDISDDSNDRALMAIARIDDPHADERLAVWARGDDDDLAEESIFWAAQARGARGLDLLDGLLEERPPADVREHMTFAYSISDSRRGIDRLLQMARRDPSGDVRSQALFWIAQQAAEEAVGELERAIEDDPELEVKEQAVFALSQLPSSEGVPLLIRVARTHDHPEVRRRAMFWLGQSDSPEALEFFEGVLAR